MNFSSSLPEGLVIPDHHLERLIGRGGYGEIWLARNVIGTYRAVKIVYRSSFDSPKPYEREFAGLKAFEPISRNHPGFVDVLQVGRNDEAGYIYYVMELADDEMSGSIVDPATYSAKTLGRVRDREGRLSASECLRIGLSLAGTLDHLHQAGLVHRDIKPSNIIFVKGEPKLADIGLVVSMSDAQTFVGSDGYIPPEGPGTFQADIYSLGKLLYEISTGQHRDQFPELPKEIAQFDDSAAVLELNEVVLKACENDRARRYKTAEEVRADMEMLAIGRSVKKLRFIERQLVRVRRVALAAVLLAIVAGLFSAVVFSLRRQERAALAKAHVTSGMKMVEEGDAYAAVPLFTAALRLESGNAAAVEAHRFRIGTALERAPRLLQFWNHSNTVHELSFSPDRARILSATRKVIRLHDIASGELHREFPIRHTIYGASYSPDGTRLAVANGNYLTMLDADTGDEIYEHKTRDLVLSAEFSPDGQTIILGCGRACGHLIDAATGRAAGIDLNGHRIEVTYATFSPDGSMIVTASRDGTGRLWEAETQQPIAVLPHAQWVLHAAFAPDGRHVATTSSDNTVFVWKVSARPHISARMEHRGGVQNVAFSPDGRWVVTAGLDHTVRFWDARTGKPVAPTVHLHSPGAFARFSRDGSRVATAEHNGGVRIWDVMDSAPLNVGRGFVSEDGGRYVTYTSNSFRVWNARNDQPITPMLNVSQRVDSVACSADARIVAVCAAATNRSATILVHNIDRDTARSWQITNARQSILLAPDGSRLLSTNGPIAALWETDTGRMIFERRDFTGRVECAVFSPDSRTIALSSSKAVYVLDARTGRNLFAPLTNALRVTSLTFSRDSSELAIATTDWGFRPGAAEIWNLRTRTRTAEFTRHTDGVLALDFTRDKRFAVTSGEDGFAFVWSTATGEPIFESLPLSAKIFSARFTPDDRWVSGCSWREAQIWDVRAGRTLTPGYAEPSAGAFEECGIVAGKQRLWVRGKLGLVFWNLPQATGEPDELLALAHQFGVSIPVGIPWNPAAFPLARLRQHCAAERAQADATQASWHAQQARRFENKPEIDWFAARFHLGQLLQQKPDDVDLRVRLDAATRQLEQETNFAATARSAPIHP